MGLNPELVLVVVIIALAVISFLFSLACRLRFELDLHDLRVAAHTLKLQHQKRIDDLQSGNVELGEVNVEILD